MGIAKSFSKLAIWEMFEEFNLARLGAQETTLSSKSSPIQVKPNLSPKKEIPPNMETSPTREEVLCEK